MAWNMATSQDGQTHIVPLPLYDALVHCNFYTHLPILPNDKLEPGPVIHLDHGPVEQL